MHCNVKVGKEQARRKRKKEGAERKREWGGKRRSPRCWFLPNKNTA